MAALRCWPRVSGLDIQPSAKKCRGYASRIIIDLTASACPSFRALSTSALKSSVSAASYVLTQYPTEKRRAILDLMSDVDMGDLEIIYAASRNIRAAGDGEKKASIKFINEV